MHTDRARAGEGVGRGGCGGAEQALTNYQHAEVEVAQGELEKALKGYQEAEAPAAEAALREREKALTN